MNRDPTDPSPPQRSSALYLGWVRHRRTSDVRHGFRLLIFYGYFDLAEVPGIFRLHPWWRRELPAPVSWRRADLLRSPGDLADAVRDLVAQRTGLRPAGPIRVLTHLRTWGYVFNPVTFYYCFDQAGGLSAIVADITNTPWGERHAYVLSGSGNRVSGTFAKQFHISPFQGMDQRYRWRFTDPGRHLAIHMITERGGRAVFDATLVLRRQPITANSLGRILWRFPHITLLTIAAIHWQALRLWWKGARYHPHPPIEASAHQAADQPRPPAIPSTSRAMPSSPAYE